DSLAYHYYRSANAWKAVRYLHLSGLQALRRSAHNQGISQLQSSLELLRTLPIKPDHIQQEIVLQIDVGVALGQVKGYSALEVGQGFVRARDLCQQLVGSPQLVQALWGLWYFHFARAEHLAAREIAERCVAEASELQEQPLLVDASFMLGG